MRTPHLILGILGALSLLAGCVDTPPWLDDDHCFDCCGEGGDGFGGCPHPFPEPVQLARSLPALAQAEVAPVPISGGTMFIPEDQDYAIIADPDTDQVHRVAFGAETGGLHEATLALEPGDEPGRVVGKDGRYFVALRGAGAVIRLDADLVIDERFSVCSSPRGLYFDGEAGELLVACLEGDLVRLDAESGEELSRQRLDGDLRDVIIAGEHVYVTHFRSANITVLRRDGEGEPSVLVIEDQEDIFRGFGGAGLRPSVAYRMIEHEGHAIVLHQLARSQDPVEIGRTGGYGGFDCTPSLVQAAITTVADGELLMTTPLGNLVLPVDIAIDSATRDERMMVVAAGSRTDDVVGGFAPRAPAVADTRLSEVQFDFGVSLGCEPGVTYDDGRRPTAVGFSSDGRAVILTRAPTALHVLESDEYVELPGPDVFDTGHELFFGDAGAGIACASCHAEGGDDGLVWNFSGIGPRRTQELRGGLLGTEPFHWDGDMADFQHLANEVFSQRMSGPVLPEAYADAVATYIDSMPVPAHGDHVDPLAAERGRAIFESVETQCSVCHGGPRLSSPGSFDIGTGGPFQVPSLVGVGLRAPFLHTGCADTLEARFSAECGGETHGRVDHLAAEELEDLIAYLESV